MKKDYRKNMTGFQYKLILGIFVTGFLLGLVLLAMTFDIQSFMTWAFIIWEAFLILTIYCWTDEERYAKYEYYGTPVMFGLLGLLFAALAIGGLYIGAVSNAEESSLSGPLGGILGSFCCGLCSYFSYIFYIRPYFKKDKEDI